MVIAGPYAAEMLAEMGARVIKVDATPEREQTISTGGGMAPMNLKNYAGKEAIQVNLQSPEGQKIIHQLIARSDVLLHNFRPGVPERLAIDWDTCRRINPRLIHVYVGAYGATGPHHRRPGAHPIPGALLGGALRQAGRANPPPAEQPMNLEEIKEVSRLLMRANEGNPDPNTSQALAYQYHAGVAGARALRSADRRLKSRCCRATPGPTPTRLMTTTAGPLTRCPTNNATGSTRFIASTKPATAGSFSLVSSIANGRRSAPRRTAPNYWRMPGSQARPPAKITTLSLPRKSGRFLRRAPAGEWEQLLTAAGVACVQADWNVGMFLEEHPQAAANRMAVEVESPRFGKYLRHGALIDFSDAPGRLRHGPFNGEHTVRVMQELGYTDEQIAELRSHGIIHWEEVRRLPSTR